MGSLVVLLLDQVSDSWLVLFVFWFPFVLYVPVCHPTSTQSQILCHFASCPPQLKYEGYVLLLPACWLLNSEYLSRFLSVGNYDDMGAILALFCIG